MKTDRRQFLQQAMSGAVAPLLIGAEGPANQHGGGAGLKGVTLENDLIRAVFDPATGALLEFSNTQTDRHFQHRRELGRSFVLVAPLPERLLHVIDGLHQIPPKIGKGADGKRLEFAWDGLRSEHAGRLDIRLTAVVELNEWGLVFDMEIENRSSYRVESIAYPYIGDLARPRSGELRRANYNYCNLSVVPLFPSFENERGYWGTEYPIQMVPTPESPFVLILDDQEGLYAGCHDVSPKERVEFTFQLKPGFGRVGEVPPGDEIGGEKVSIEFFPTHLPFAQPGESYQLSPIVLKPFVGDWHAGTDYYKAWRRTWMKQPHVPKWLQDVHSWQMLQMSTWGDSLRIRYKDLVKYGEVCVRHGVKGIQLIGWTLYGQDGRLPIHDIDPRLGLGGEGCYDLQNRHYTLSYHRAGVGHVPAIRYIDPWLPMMNWVYGYDDREGVNICLLYRYIISYEPRNFRGYLGEFPLTLEYGKKMDALRRRYREFLWDAEFQDTIGATVRDDGGKLVYAIFRHARSGRRAVVVVNHDRIPIPAEVRTAANSRQFVAVSPEEPEPRTSDGKIHVPARSAIVLIES